MGPKPSKSVKETPAGNSGGSPEAAEGRPKRTTKPPARYGQENSPTRKLKRRESVLNPNLKKRKQPEDSGENVGPPPRQRKKKLPQASTTATDIRSQQEQSSEEHTNNSANDQDENEDSDVLPQGPPPIPRKIPPTAPNTRDHPGQPEKDTTTNTRSSREDRVSLPKGPPPIPKRIEATAPNTRNPRQRSSDNATTDAADGHSEETSRGPSHDPTNPDSGTTRPPPSQIGSRTRPPQSSASNSRPRSEAYLQPPSSSSHGSQRPAPPQRWKPRQSCLKCPFHCFTCRQCPVFGHCEDDDPSHPRDNLAGDLGALPGWEFVPVFEPLGGSSRPFYWLRPAPADGSTGSSVVESGRPDYFISPSQLRDWPVPTTPQQDPSQPQQEPPPKKSQQQPSAPHRPSVWGEDMGSGLRRGLREIAPELFDQDPKTRPNPAPPASSSLQSGSTQQTRNPNAGDVQSGPTFPRPTQVTPDVQINFFNPLLYERQEHPWQTRQQQLQAPGHNIVQAEDRPHVHFPDDNNAPRTEGEGEGEGEDVPELERYSTPEERRLGTPVEEVPESQHSGTPSSRGGRLRTTRTPRSSREGTPAPEPDLTARNQAARQASEERRRKTAEKWRKEFTRKASPKKK